MRSKITHYDLLDQQACDQISAEILEYRHRWQPVIGGLFYTLGLPLYQYQDNIALYRQSAQETNHTLFEKFDTLYTKILRQLSDIVSSPVNFFPRAAIPGFHIFTYDGVKSYSGGGAHFDLSHQKIPYLPHEAFNSNLDTSANLSFVVPLKLPQCGSGIEVWNFTYEQLLQGQICKQENPGYFEYHLGQMCIHSGYRWHQIPACENAEDNEHRITLQGHMIQVNGRWIAYW